MNEIRFTKLQALGNDFLVSSVEDLRRLRSAREMAQQMCERHYGAGADGLIYVTPARHADADFASRTFNADGSEAEISGNGTRCVAAYLYYTGQWSAPEIRIATVAGIKVGRHVAREGTSYEFEFDMGRPIFSSGDIPMSLDQPLERVIGFPLRLGGDLIEVTCMSMGNPQCIIFVSDLKAVALSELGPLIEDHPAFPNRTNVEFVHVVSREEIEILIWERGAGHTLSSGTGSCASAVASILNGFTDRSVKVRTEGGNLRVEWGEDSRLSLTGSAEVIYEGRWLREP